MKYISVLIILCIFFSLASCDWLMQDSDKNSNEETSEVTTGDGAKDAPPGDGVPSY